MEAPATYGHDGTDALRKLHFDRRGALLRRPVAQLTSVVRSPAPNGAIVPDGQPQFKPSADGDDVVEARHRSRLRSVPPGRPIAQLPPIVLAPRPHAASSRQR